MLESFLQIIFLLEKELGPQTANLFKHTPSVFQFFPLDLLFQIEFEISKRFDRQ